MCCQVEHANCFLRLSTIHSSPCFSALPGQTTAPLAWLAALSLVSSIHFPHSSLRDLSEISLPKEIYGQVTTILRVKSRFSFPALPGFCLCLPPYPFHPSHFMAFVVLSAWKPPPTATFAQLRHCSLVPLPGGVGMSVWLLPHSPLTLTVLAVLHEGRNPSVAWPRVAFRKPLLIDRVIRWSGCEWFPVAAQHN